MLGKLPMNIFKRFLDMSKKTLSPERPILTQPVKDEKLDEVERKRKGAERMLKALKVKAVLLSDVSFQTNEGMTKLESGQHVFVDPETNIAHFGGLHFDLLKEEYKVLYMN